MQALEELFLNGLKTLHYLPTGRDENGYLKYIDFSYSNAYDFLSRPFRAVVNCFSTNRCIK